MKKVDNITKAFKKAELGSIYPASIDRNTLINLLNNHHLEDEAADEAAMHQTTNASTSTTTTGNTSTPGTNTGNRLTQIQAEDNSNELFRCKAKAAMRHNILK